MKQFKFNHNDYVTVTLTKEGAEHLSQKRKDVYDKYPLLKRGKCDYKEGDVYRTQFWALINNFDEILNIGCRTPFERGEITVDSSIEFE